MEKIFVVNPMTEFGEMSDVGGRSWTEVQDCEPFGILKKPGEFTQAAGAAGTHVGSGRILPLFAR
jgi:hypothetical protein